MIRERINRLKQAVYDIVDEWADARSPQADDVTGVLPADYDESAALQGRYGGEERARAMDRARLWARHAKPEPMPSHDYSIFGD